MSRSYSVDVFFKCQSKARLYKLLDKLRELAVLFRSENPSPVYEGDGRFVAYWPGGKGELQDTNVGVCGLKIEGLVRPQYQVARQTFDDYWDENYNITVQQIAHDTRRLKKPKRKKAG